MSKSCFTGAAILSVLGTGVFGQSFVESGQVVTRAPEADRAVLPFVSETGVNGRLPEGRQLTCPADLLAQAYREATTGFQAASQYVTTLEVLNLCAEHDRIFKEVVEAERQLIESYTALQIAKGQGRRAAVTANDAGRVTEPAEAGSSSDAEKTAADQFLAQAAQCLTSQSNDLSLDQKMTVAVPFSADGKIAGEIALVAAGDGDVGALQAEFVLAEQAILTCGTGGYEIDGHDFSEPLNAQFSLSDLFALKLSAQQEAGVDENGCAIPRPADAYELVGHLAAAGRAPFADLAVVDSFDQAAGWFTQTYFASVGEALPGGVKILAIDIADYDDPADVTEVTLSDCAGELNIKASDRMAPRVVQSPRHTVTFRNLRTGEVTAPPDPIIIPQRHE